MESYPCSTLTTGCLSVAAQKVLAALKAQYTGRMHGTRHMDNFSGELRLSQNQDNYSKHSELHTQTNTVDKVQSQIFNQVPDMNCSSLSAIALFNTEVNKCTQRKRDEECNWKFRDYGDNGSLFPLNVDDKITPLRNNNPEGEKPFLSRLGTGDWGNPQTVSNVILSEKPREIARRNEKIHLKCPTETCATNLSEEVGVTYSPPRKQRSFGHQQMCSASVCKRFQEGKNGKKFEPERQSGSCNKINVWCLEAKREANKGVMDISLPENITVGMSEKIQLNCFDKVNGEKILISGNEKDKNSLQLLLDHTHWRDESSNREPLKDSLDVSGSSSPDETTNGELDLQIESNEQEPVQKVLGISVPHVLTKATHNTLEDHSMDEVIEGEENESTCFKPCVSVPQSHQKNVQTEAADSIEQEHSATSVVRGTHPCHKGHSQVDERRFGEGCVLQTVSFTKKPGKWKPLHEVSIKTISQETCVKQTVSMPRISNPLPLPSTSHPHTIHPYKTQDTQPFNQQKELQSINKRPVPTVDFQIELKKQGQNESSHSDVPRSSKKKCSASEKNDQMYLEGDKGADVTSASSKLTLALTSDVRICDASRLPREERVRVLEEAGRARALVISMVYENGTTQLDPEQKPPPAVCGILVMLKKSLDSLDLEQMGTSNESVIFLRLEQRPVWAQQDPQDNQDIFTREVLLQMVSGAQSLVCFKAKELFRTTLMHFSRDLNWKQVASCQVLDPQIAAWLLDPADSACCFQDLLNKHCTRPATHPTAPNALGHNKVTQAIASLSHLHRLMVELRNNLQTQGLWQLYSCMEQKMIPLLAAMESHRIYVDKEALKKTSEMLGVLFEKLRLQERCENKKLPKTVLKQQQSTSEAALLQLQDLHPLPKIILEYRQIHKIKSTFLDGILSCVTKSFISSTWNQTSTVSGRLSAKHPNFQALPKQPVQIVKKQNIQGKETELVTVHPRSMFIPQDGWTFLSADFCQVELRLLAHLSSDPALLCIFQNPEADVFTMLASQWKGVSEDGVSSEDREHTKRIVYSVIYGAGKERLSGILGVSAEEASRFQDSFLQTYREVQAFIQCTVQHCHKYGYVRSIMGRRRSLPHVHSTDWGIRNQAERQAVNFVVQGSAADLCKMAMIQICSHVSSSSTLTARLVAQIHDELLFEVEDSQVEDFAVLVKKTMESLQHIDCLKVRLKVPLKVSVSKGRSWGSMCEFSFPHTPTHTSL
ncbi:DNA polymerase nu isoform X2 [Hoplias malabaricus]|uniref:DNA polymerase nu isoform X2 n=1 Tax=Hoplias malabaricus TaxID=27720 RepID=UPI0034626960